LDSFSLLGGGELADRPETQQRRLHRNYATVSERFQMIEDDTFQVLVPFGASDARDKIIHDLHRSLRQRGKSIRSLMQRAQPFIVNCRNRQQRMYEQEGMIIEIVPGLWEWKGGYDQKLGLTDTRLEPEGLFV
ncbi:MAG: hypothetical protein ACR2OU_09330, partial [Thermomicrobiales bacterium]